MLKKSLTLVAVIALTACQAVPLNKEAELVRVTLKDPSEHCQYLGEVTGNQGDAISGLFTSNEDLETGARNKLKNLALAKGGNTIYLLTNRAGVTGNYDTDYGGGSTQTNVTLTGGVYFCSNSRSASNKD